MSVLEYTYWWLLFMWMSLHLHIWFHFTFYNYFCKQFFLKCTYFGDQILSVRKGCNATGLVKESDLRYSSILSHTKSADKSLDKLSEKRDFYNSLGTQSCWGYQNNYHFWLPERKIIWKVHRISFIHCYMCEFLQ